MEHAIQQTMFEFAQTVQRLVQKGWVFGEINYGRQSWDIGPSISLIKGDESVLCHSYQEIEQILTKEQEGV